MSTIQDGRPWLRPTDYLPRIPGPPSHPSTDWESRLVPLESVFEDVAVVTPFEEMEEGDFDNGWRRPALRPLVTEWADVDIVSFDSSKFRHHPDVRTETGHDHW